MQEHKTIDIYAALRRITEGEETFTVIFTSVNMSKNEGGQIITLDNQKVGAKRKNKNDRMMLGIEDARTGEHRHIYIHSILEIGINSTGEYFKLKL